MDSEMDDPFTTPNRNASFDPSMILSLSSSSPNQLKRTLEAHLQEVNKRIENAGALGRKLLTQQQDIEANIKELEEGGDTVDPELKKKLVDLEKEYIEVGREASRAALTSKVMTGGISPLRAGNLSGGSPSAIQAQGTNSPTKLSVPSRRQRNQSSRQHDLEFAAELGQGLLVEVRRLQALLSEREEALKVVQIEKARLEQLAEGLEARIRALDESEQKFKEENWDLELQNQELLGQIRDHKEDNDKLQALILHEANDKELLLKDLDEWKDRNEKLYEDLEAEHKHHESEFAAMRRSLANNETDRHIMEKKLEDLRVELEESHNQSLRLRSALEHKSDDRDGAGLFDMQPAQTTPEHSPPPSPTKPTPRHTHLESETLKSSLQHAHRMIANLKSSVNREKSEKAELKRLLQDARDDLETARLRRDSVGGPPSSADKRRKGKSSFVKGGRPPIFKATLLGGLRQSRDEITIIDNHLVDEDWEEAPEDEPSPTRRSFPVLTEYTLRAPEMDSEDTVFETANETAGDNTTDAFETAYEQNTATETETYKTGNDSPVNDYPTSADDMTETEGGALLKVIQKKSSVASSFGRQVRPLKLGGIRRESVASTASTEDDEDINYHYTVYGDDDDDDDDAAAGEGRHSAFTTPTATGNQRLKLRVNRARGRGSRMPSQFSTRDRTFSADSSPGGGIGRRSGSPASLNQRLHTPGERKSLFAELEDGMLDLDGGEGEDDEGETETETEAELDDVPTTPTRNLTPFTPVGLERSSFLGIGDLERPRTAHSAISAATIEERSSTTDVGTQSERAVIAVTANAETQSDEILVRPVPKMTEIGTQFDPELENTLAPVVGMEDAHGSRKEGKGKGFFAIPLPIPIPIRASAPDLSNDLRVAEENRKLAEEVARQAEADRKVAAGVALLAEQSQKVAEAAATKSALDFVSAQQELTALKPKIIALETEILGLRDERTVLQEKAGAQVELDTLKPKIGVLEKEIDALMAERSVLQEKVEAQEGEVTVLQPKVVTLEMEIENLRHERAILAEKAMAHEELIIVKPRIMLLEKEMDNLTIQHANLQEKAMAQEEEVATMLKPKIAVLEKEIEALTAERASLQEKTGSQEKEIVTVLQPKIAVLEKEVETLALERASLQEDLGAHKKEVGTVLQPKILALEQDIETLTIEQASLQEKTSAQEKEVNIVLVPKIAVLEKEIEALTLERTTLQQNTAAQEKEVNVVLVPKIAILEKEIEVLTLERTTLQQNTAAQEKEINVVLVPKIAILEKEIEVLTLERTTLQQNTAAQEKEVNVVLVPKIAILEKEIEALTLERTTLQQNTAAQEKEVFDVLKPKIIVLEKNIETLTTELASLQDKVQAQEDKEVTVLQPRILALENDIETLATERASLQEKSGAHEKEVNIVLIPRIAVLEKEIHTLMTERVSLQEKTGAQERKEFTVLQPKIVALEKEVVDLKDERAVLQVLAGAHEEVDVLKPRIVVLEKEVESLKVERDGLQEKAVTHEEEVIVLKPKLVSLEKEIQDLKDDRAILQEQAAAHKEEVIVVLKPTITALEKEVESLTAERASLQKRVGAAEEVTDILKPKIVALEEEVERLTVEGTGLQKMVEAHEEEITVLRPKIIVLGAEAESLKVERDGLQEKVSRHEEELLMLKPRIVTLETEIETLNTERATLQEKVGVHIEEVLMLKPRVAVLEKELESLSVEYASLQEKARAYEKEVSVLKPKIEEVEREIGSLKDERVVLAEMAAIHEATIALKEKEVENLVVERVSLLEKAGTHEKELIALKPRIVALEEEILALKNEQTTLVDALAAVPVKQEMKNTGIQFDPELEMVEEEYTLVIDKVAEVEPSVPEFEAPLEFSKIQALSITPVEPELTRALTVPVPIIVSSPAVDASVSSDDETPKKVSETVEDAQQRPTTPSPEKHSRFFGSMFGWKRPGSPAQEPEGLSGASERTFSNSTFGVIEKTIIERDEVVKATEPVPVSDQSAQTDITSEFFDNLSAAKTVDKGKRPAFAVVAPESMFTGDRSLAKTPSLQSRTSHDSFGLNKTRGGAIRPESASSLREHHVTHLPLPVASAPHEIGSMGPPPVRSNSTLAQRNNVTFGPKNPSTDTIKPVSPEGSKAGTTPRPKFSNSRSEVSSPTSRRSSISSFASEIDSRFNIAPEAVASEAQTDPRMIQAITQTMIGEYLWKYTRGAGRGTLSASRHKRFFWVHPYTRTLYWSDRDPTTAGRAELRAKSVAIEAVRVVTDDNPMPPGLHRKSLVIVTPGRSLKFTAPTGQRHETWFNALSYLLLRTGGELGDEENGLMPEDVRDFNPIYNNGVASSIRGAESLSSYNTRTTRASSPARNVSSLSNKRPGEKVVRQGSMSRLSHLFRPASGFGTFSTRSSRNNNPSLYDQTELNDSAEDLREQIEQENGELLENVRACCDGKHDVGTLPRGGGRKNTRGGRGRDHHHHHTQHNHERNT